MRNYPKWSVGPPVGSDLFQKKTAVHEKTLEQTKLINFSLDTLGKTETIYDWGPVQMARVTSARRSDCFFICYYFFSPAIFELVLGQNVPLKSVLKSPFVLIVTPCWDWKEIYS